MRKEVKILVLGSSGVGKSSLTHRFIHDQFSQKMPATLAAVSCQKQYICPDGQVIRFQFWDTAGQERFRSIAKIYYKDAKAAILMYDVTSQQSFAEMKMWMEELKEKGPDQLALAVVGNKIDEPQHKVSVLEAQNYANTNNSLFAQISVKENRGIDELFSSIAKSVQRVQEPNKFKRIIVSSKNTKKKSGKQCP